LGRDSVVDATGYYISRNVGRATDLDLA